MQVSCKNPSVSREITVEYDFGTDLQDAVEKFGADIVFSGFVADAKVGLQAIVRARLGKSDDEYMSDEEILAEAAQWKPGVRKQAADPMAKLQALLIKLTPEQRALILEGAI